VRKTAITLPIRSNIKIKIRINISSLRCTVVLHFVVLIIITRRYEESLRYTYMDNYFISLYTIYFLVFNMHRDIIVNVIYNLIMAYSLTISRFILCRDTKDIIDCSILAKRYNCTPKHIIKKKMA